MYVQRLGQRQTKIDIRAAQSAALLHAEGLVVTRHPDSQHTHRFDSRERRHVARPNRRNRPSERFAICIGDFRHFDCARVSDEARGNVRVAQLRSGERECAQQLPADFVEPGSQRGLQVGGLQRR